MFENGFLSFFKSSKQEEPQPTWNATTMTMEQPANYTGSQEAQPASSSQEEQQMKLRGGGGCCDVCCGW
ncbi:hypothetical protein BGW36DRAFT_428713 [Talaromyces proteolyticus]|uniref:Cysteine-rich transmembrane CYSTM domain-containing protein n=1 Tax=Talaromyces proteolyticus TaxID=1131652 RepID=A0AAD4KQA2_9EURO|nr:uncharacterized protein BGW36DRAFT_428713 [Talaromyces proteolyticus]KAH8696721.1 hypothetical protein BGW36DRAFT_428713 [Talaromyces proteolyticus]